MKLKLLELSAVRQPLMDKNGKVNNYKYVQKQVRLKKKNILK